MNSLNRLIVSRKEEIIRMLGQQPDDEFLLYALGMECLSENNQNEAKKIFLKLAEKSSDPTDAYFRLAQVEESTGNIPKALEYAQKALHYAEKKNHAKSVREIRSLIQNLELEN